jgi:hypothetical protein
LHSVDPQADLGEGCFGSLGDERIKHQFEAVWLSKYGAYLRANCLVVQLFCRGKAHKAGFKLDFSGHDDNLSLMQTSLAERLTDKHALTQWI